MISYRFFITYGVGVGFPLAFTASGALEEFTCQMRMRGSKWGI